MRSRYVLKEMWLALVFVLGSIPLQAHVPIQVDQAMEKPPACTADSGIDREAKIQDCLKCGVSTKVIEVNGQRRSYSLFRPKIMASVCAPASGDRYRTHPYPLVLVFHGSYANGREINGQHPQDE